MMIAAIVGAMLMSAIPGVTTEARGQQFLPMVWDQRDMPGSIDVHEEAVAMMYWEDPSPECGAPSRFLFVTGWGTNAVTGHTFIATYKYNVEGTTEEERRVVNPAIFPPLGSPLSISAKPTAIDVDPITGEVYIVGWVQNPGVGRTDTDYIILKYNSNLEPGGGWGQQPPYDTVGVRHYDGPIGGNDRGVDIKIATPGAQQQGEKRLFVTGTSMSAAHGNDIVTLRLSLINGNPIWVNRFDGFSGADEAVRMVWALATELAGVTGGSPIVAGTSYGGPTRGHDYVALLYKGDTGALWDRWLPADPDNRNGVRRYNGPGSGDDWCSDMKGAALPEGFRGVGARLAICGTVTPVPGGPTEDTDYGVWCLGTDVGNTFWTRTWDGGDPKSSRDMATSLTLVDVPSADNVHVWVTGNSKQDDLYDIATIVIEMFNPPPPAPQGPIIGEHFFQSRVWTPREIYIAGSGPAYLTTWHFSPYEDPMFTIMVARFQLSPIGPSAAAFYGGLYGLDNRPAAISVVGPGPGTGVYVTGRSASTLFGLDFMTLRYEP